jgi:predicted nucleic acid-binding protein
MRVMLDTSVLISIFVFPSEHFVRFRRSLAKHQIVLCSYVVDELKDVVARKFPERTKGVDAFLQSLPFSMSYTPEHFDTDDFPRQRFLGFGD